MQRNCKWAYAKNEDTGSEKVKYRERFVGKKDYSVLKRRPGSTITIEVLSPIVKHSSIRILLALVCAQLDLKLAKETRKPKEVFSYICKLTNG